MGYTYVSRGFKNYQLVDLFDNELHNCSESDFNDFIVNYRTLFYVQYFSDYQDFYDKKNHNLVARRYYL